MSRNPLGHQVDLERDPEGSPWFRVVLGILCLIAAYLIAQGNDDATDAYLAAQPPRAAAR